MSDAANSIERTWLEPHKWQPGQSGNPKGRPAGIKALREKLDGDKLRAELEAIAYADDHRNKFDALRLLSAYKWGPPCPLDEDLTVRDALLSMSIDRARELMEGTSALPRDTE